MLKLIKWVALGTVVVGASGYFLFGTHALSYIGTAANSIREGISEKIPIEFELKRAEGLIREIDPQLHEAKRQVAQASVELDQLQADIERLERAVAGGRDKLQNVSAGLGTGESPVKLAGYDRVRVEMNLERTFDTYRNNVAMLKGKRALIERQTHAVAAARTHLDAVRTEKARLQDMIAALKTQKRQLDALAASATHISLDDTALGQAREVLNDVKNRLDVAQKMLEDDIFFEGPAAAHSSQRDIVGEIEKYFAGGDEAEGVTVEVGEAFVEVR